MHRHCTPAAWGVSGPTCPVRLLCLLANRVKQREQQLSAVSSASNSNKQQLEHLQRSGHTAAGSCSSCPPPLLRVWTHLLTAANPHAYSGLLTTRSGVLLVNAVKTGCCHHSCLLCKDSTSRARQPSRLQMLSLLLSGPS